MTDEIDFTTLFETLPKRQLLTVQEVAVFMHVTRQTVYNWYPDKLKGTNVSGVIRIYRQSVIEMVKENHGKKKGEELQPDNGEKPKQEEPRQRRRRSWVHGW